jgi:ABC-type branched-subunit amino acid transport system substrate-binding protein
VQLSLRAPRRAIAAAAALALLALAGCGSRLPQHDFASAAPPQAGVSAGGSGDYASDTGVTANSITIGIVNSVTSPLGSDTFTGPLYGAQAFFRALDAAGGLHGRTVRVVTCDDGGSGIGNQSCVHQLIDQDAVFAFTAGSVLDYAGASYVSSKGVPDVGSEPVGTAYDQYPHLYGIYGSNEPRDGSSVGWNGTQYQTTEVYRYFRQHLGADRAAVISYNQADSARYAAQLVQGLKAEGYSVLQQTVDFALPDFGAVAAGLKAAGTQLLFDAMDTRGNVGLCKAMDADGVHVLAKVTNVQNWSEQARSDYASTPGCRAVLWATSDSRNYEDTQYPAVAAFRAATNRYYPDRAGQLSQWELEGWAGAQWLTDAMRSCGAALTRSCVERFMNSGRPYDAHGLLIPTAFTHAPAPTGPQHACLDAARWEDSAEGGHGGWVTQVGDMDTNCFQVPALPYRP